MTLLVMKARTAVALGLPSIARIIQYRFGLLLGLNPVQRLRPEAPRGPFFCAASAPVRDRAARPGKKWHTSGLLFSWWPLTVTDRPPQWFSNPLSGRLVPAPERDWWRIPDFDPAIGDIKNVWELSRMHWLLAFAQRASCGDKEALTRLNSWLADWCMRNPPYKGPNWKCGQEASIRVMHVAAAALILGEIRDASPGTRDFILVHLQRIEPTLQYAIGQNNNHGTSEAAALYIGGAWLESLNVPSGSRWKDLGRKWLEDRARRLIGPDGSFSQYSLNYHRLMVDALSLAEVWRRHLHLPSFSEEFLVRAASAVHWMRQMIVASTGGGPNVGANDGACLLQLSDTAYGDYRPSIQLAMTLFTGMRAYGEDGAWNDTLKWLGVPVPSEESSPPGSFVAEDSGFVVLRMGMAMLMMRYPRFRFRPSQADALHVDLWIGEENVLRDGGSYSYNTDENTWRYFSGTASHNTIQFDGRDQMPRIGRFLFGDWLTAYSVTPLSTSAGGQGFSCGYRDACGARHHRSVFLRHDKLRVVDEVADFKRCATLRWRLAPGPWVLDGFGVTNGSQTLRLSCSSRDVRCALVTGWESRHYQEMTAVPVLELELREPCSVTSEVQWDIK